MGAKSDMAEALAYRFAKAGYNIYLAARNHQTLAPLASDIQIRHGVEAWPLEFDALDYKSHSHFYASLSHRPQVVINVFGLLGEQQKAQQDFDHAHLIIDSNYTGCVSILNIIANDYEQAGNGSIIGISSVAGLRGRKSNYIYGSAKAAFTTYLEGLRHRLFLKNVHVMTVLPGFVATQMTAGMPLPKPLTAQPTQVAEWIYKGYTKRKQVIYTMPLWRWIMLLIRNIPGFIFYKSNL